MFVVRHAVKFLLLANAKILQIIIIIIIIIFFFFFFFFRNLDSAVSVITRLQARLSGFRFPAEATYRFIVQNYQSGSGFHPAFYSSGIGIKVTKNI
jgi:hypothetical protein